MSAFDRVTSSRFVGLNVQSQNEIPVEAKGQSDLHCLVRIQQVRKLDVSVPIFFVLGRFDELVQIDRVGEYRIEISKRRVELGVA